MAKNRNMSGHTPGWMSAVIFNALLIVLPLIGVKTLIGGFAGAPHDVPPTAERLAETRRVIDDAFEDLAGSEETARAEWARLIGEQLEDRNMSAARGFMLAAPQMLGAGDQRAIRAAAEAEPSGTEDERLLRATLIFLPSDIRVGYETSVRPRGLNLVKIEREPTDTPEDETELGTDDDRAAEDAVQDPPASAQSEPLANLVSMNHTPAFSILGTLEDLVSQSRDWLRGDHQHKVEMRLTGLAMATPPSATGIEQEDLAVAASILKTAWRSNRLQPEYADLLEQRLEKILPDAVLEANLTAALADVSTLNIRAERVQDAFAMSVNESEAVYLGPELAQIAQISDATSARGALSLIEQARTSNDMLRARLIAQSGGDRAIALVSQLGPDALALTGTRAQWSEEMVLQIMALAAAFLALALCTLSALSRMLFGRRLAAVL